MGEILFTLAMLAIFGVFLHGTFAIETGRSVDPIGAARVPEAVVILGGLLCLYILAKEIKKFMARQDTTTGKIKLNVKTMILLVLLVAFLLAMDYLGFYVCAVLLFFAITLMLGNKSYLRSAAAALVSVTVFVLLFGKVLSVPLPRGEGVFRILSHWLF